MTQKRFMQEMTWPEFQNAIQDAIVIFPIGATEQHGPHLPLGTDSLISFEILNIFGAAINAPDFCRYCKFFTRPGS